MNIKIKFTSWYDKKDLEIEADSLKEAVEKAVKEGANLSGADLCGANLSGANLSGAKHGGKELWETRPVLQLGISGSRNSTTLVYFYEDRSEPRIYCGCFRGTIKEFSEKVKETHSGTFYEYEYNAMIDYIKKIREYQLKEK